MKKIIIGVFILFSGMLMQAQTTHKMKIEGKWQYSSTLTIYEDCLMFNDGEENVPFRRIDKEVFTLPESGKTAVIESLSPGDGLIVKAVWIVNESKLLISLPDGVMISYTMLYPLKTIRSKVKYYS